MSPASIMIVAFLIALVVMSGTFAGGAVIVAVPVAVIGIAIIGLLDYRRRHMESKGLQKFKREAATEKVDFTERDKETLTTE